MKIKAAIAVLAVILVPVAKSEPIYTDALVVSKVEFEVSLGTAAEAVPIQFKTGDCLFFGTAALNPSIFKASVRLERKVCANTEVEANGFAIDLRGFYGVPVRCLELNDYTNRVGSKICLSGYVAAGTEVTLIEK